MRKEEGGRRGGGGDGDRKGTYFFQGEQSDSLLCMCVKPEKVSTFFLTMLQEQNCVVTTII